MGKSGSPATTTVTPSSSSSAAASRVTLPIGWSVAAGEGLDDRPGAVPVGGIAGEVKQSGKRRAIMPLPEGTAEQVAERGRAPRLRGMSSVSEAVMA